MIWNSLETTAQSHNILYLCCLISYEMSENIDESEEAQERKAIPREPTEVGGAKESKGTE